MNCEKDDAEMESMGYGDYVCPECGAVRYAESEEDFNGRILGEQLAVVSETKKVN